MTTFVSRLFTLVMGVLALVLVGVENAEAKRLGSGQSFGSKESYSTPYQRSTPDMSKPMSSTAAPSAAQQHNAMRQADMSKRSGLMGMLGGLALGGLLGALFFGGAFENINFLDILLFAAIAFMIFMFIARRRQAAASASGLGGGPSFSQPMQRNSTATDNSGFGSVSSGLDYGDLGASTSHASHEVPADFNQAEFLDKAKSAYYRLQQAWDQGDLSFLRDFTTASVYSVLQAQLDERSGANKTEVLSLDAELLEARRAGGQYEAQVLFHAMLREQDSDSLFSNSRTEAIKEVWHFVRPVDAGRPTWYLDGIQQVEA